MSQENLAAVSTAVDDTAQACAASADTLVAGNLEATEQVSGLAARTNEDAAGRARRTLEEVRGGKARFTCSVLFCLCYRQTYYCSCYYYWFYFWLHFLIFLCN